MAWITRIILHTSSYNILLYPFFPKNEYYIYPMNRCLSFSRAILNPWLFSNEILIVPFCLLDKTKKTWVWWSMELKALPEDAEIISGSKNMANSHRTSILHVVPFNLDTLKFQSTVIMFMVVSHHFSVHCPVDIFGQTSKTEQIFGVSARFYFQNCVSHGPCFTRHGLD